jgi:RNA polymerase primary sigma factor
MALSMLLRMAVLAGVQEAVRLRIRIGDDVNAVDAKGRTPLILAASKGHVEICTLLLDSGADLQVADAAGETALAAADRRGHAKLTALLRESLAASSEPGKNGTSPILMIDVPAVAVADADLPPPTLVNRLLSIGPGIQSVPVFAADQTPALSSRMVNAVSTPDPLDFARPASPYADSLADLIPDDDEPFDLSVWEPDEDQPLPEHDTGCAAAASMVRSRIATHTPVDTDADWTDIDISLPDPERSVGVARSLTMIDWKLSATC